MASDNGEDGDNDGQVSNVGSSYSSSSIPCPHTANRAKQSKSIYLHSTCGIEAVGYKLRGMIHFAAESDNGEWYWRLARVRGVRVWNCRASIAIVWSWHTNRCVYAVVLLRRCAGWWCHRYTPDHGRSMWHRWCTKLRRIRCCGFWLGSAQVSAIVVPGIVIFGIITLIVPRTAAVNRNSNCSPNHMTNAAAR